MEEALLIVSNIPELSSKTASWFRKNRKKIEHSLVASPFWKRNAFILSKEWTEGTRKLTERLLEAGYGLEPWPDAKGSFSIRGGTVLIFPVNEESC